MAKAYIMVVDDEPDIRQLLQEILEDEDYEVAVAHNGASARALRATRRPDLILLDIMMPEMSGYEFLKTYRKERDTPVILLTARLEAHVGKDLQYIRINGTVVGGLVGLLIYAATTLAGR